MPERDLVCFRFPRSCQALANSGCTREGAGMSNPLVLCCALSPFCQCTKVFPPAILLQSDGPDRHQQLLEQWQFECNCQEKSAQAGCGRMQCCLLPSGTGSSEPTGQ